MLRQFAIRGLPDTADLRRSVAFAFVAVVLAVSAGALVGLAPPYGFVAAFVGVSAIWLVALGARVERLFVVAVGVLFLGYAFFGRGLAYRGVPPVYVGEMVLALGAIASISALRIRRLHVLHLLIAAFMAWGAIRTVPFVGTYQIDAFRDGVVWGYALFAIAVSLTVRRSDIDSLLGAIERILPFYILWAPIAVLFSISAGSPDPGSVPVLFVKTGDTGVNLAAAGALVIVGLSTMMTGARETLFWLPWLGTTALVGAVNRASMLAAMCAGVAFLFVRSSIRWIRVVLISAVLIGAIGLINPEVNLGIERRLSFQQLATNLMSVVVPQNDPIVDGTKEWRLRWWDTIFKYTLEGPYFWTGKGFGINLADDDGFQVLESGALREPHNGHIAILARAGVPGLALWVLLQGGYAVSLLRAAWIARRNGQTVWVQVFGVLVVYWLASMTNMSFDVYLEGPQGGIPFWSSIGLGLASIKLAEDDRRAGRKAQWPDPSSMPPRSASVQPIAMLSSRPGPAVPLIRPSHAAAQSAGPETEAPSAPKKRPARTRRPGEKADSAKQRKQSKPRRPPSAAEDAG